MILFTQILLALAKIVQLAGFLLTIYQYMLIATVLLSWVNPDPYNPIVSFLHRVTEPVLSRIRRYMPAFGPIDLSPLVAFAAIYVFHIAVLDTLYLYLINYSMILKLKG